MAASPMPTSIRLLLLSESNSHNISVRRPAQSGTILRGIHDRARTGPDNGLVRLPRRRQRLAAIGVVALLGLGGSVALTRLSGSGNSSVVVRATLPPRPSKIGRAHV